MQQQDFLTRSKHRQHITEIPASLLSFPVSCRLKFERLFSVYREVNGLSLVSVNSCPRTTHSPKISRPKPVSVPQIHRIMSETAESIIIFHWLKTHHQFWLTLSDFSNKRLNPTGNPLLCFQSTPPLKVFEGQEYLHIIVLCSFMANEHNLITICAEVYYRARDLPSVFHWKLVKI